LLNVSYNIQVKEHSVDSLIEFETRIARLFDSGEIPHPVHLASGNEQNLLDIFEGINDEDWIFCSWRSHYHALLKGVDETQLETAIKSGKSIALCFPKNRFYSSAIVAGQIAMAVGVAKAISTSNSSEHVWCFIGDMTSQTGSARVAIEYANNFNLPITFVVEDNNNSVCSDTRNTWGCDSLEYEKHTFSNTISYKYISRYPHAGGGKRVQF
jgi:TPP-dependent pyruvate/acetoin dehydrogenase alpha subunit